MEPAACLPGKVTARLVHSEVENVGRMAEWWRIARTDCSRVPISGRKRPRWRIPSRGRSP